MKSVIVYFSHRGENIVNGHPLFLNKGNTQILAEKIHELTKAPLYEIKAKDAYSEKYEVVNERARKEYEQNSFPEIAGLVPNFGNFDVIFIGFPIWYRTYPRIINTFLKQAQFKGKVIVPFCTNDEGSFGTAELELASYLKADNTMKRGLSVNGFTVNECDEALNKWLNSVL